MEALLLVVEQKGPTMFARLGMRRALQQGMPTPRRKRAKAYRVIR
jgi:hypothetical protein